MGVVLYRLVLGRAYTVQHIMYSSTTSLASWCTVRIPWRGLGALPQTQGMYIRFNGAIHSRFVSTRPDPYWSARLLAPAAATPATI